MLSRIPHRTGQLAKLLLFGTLLASSAAAQLDRKRALQFATDHALERHSGTAVVLDVVSGKILAGYRLDVAARRVTAPGSAIKPFTLLALLGSNRFDPNQRWFCPRRLQLAGKEMNCSHPQVPSGFDAAEALAYSCNGYFANFASRLTEAELKQEFQRFGLFSAPGLVGDEAVGSFRPAANSDQLKLRALGEDGIAVTPLELVTAYRRLALRQRTQHGQDAANQDQAWEIVEQGLQGSADYGMANSARSAGIAVAGKTGTAGSSGSPMTHGWFAGYAPADNPEIVLVIYLERGRGMDAAALAHQLFSAYEQARSTR